jgi:RES domain-containing protein
MIVRRLCRSAHRALDGEGAFRVGGRWNSPGGAAIYASGTLALAALEYLTHLEIARAPNDLIALTIEIPDTPIERLDPARLPGDWHRVPEHPRCAEYGDRWIAEGRSLGLIVPSALIPEEDNVIINPQHGEFAAVRVVAERKFSFDPRLLT